MGSVAARPAATPLFVPINPPNTIADLASFRPILFATNGVPIITTIDLTRPAAMLNAITDESAPNAEPVTGPTMKVAVPAQIVVT